MKGWRTLAFNFGVAMVGVAGSLDYVSVLGDKWGSLLITAVGFANMALRAFTNTPVGKDA